MQLRANDVFFSNRSSKKTNVVAFNKLIIPSLLFLVDAIQLLQRRILSSILASNVFSCNRNGLNHCSDVSPPQR